MLDFIEKYKDQTTDRGYHMVKTFVEQRLEGGVNILNVLKRCRFLDRCLAKKFFYDSKLAKEMYQDSAKFCTLLIRELKKAA